MTSTHGSLQEDIRKGGQVQGAESALTDAARALGYTVFAVDCSRAKSKSAVLRAIATAVDYPEFFGSNLDALLDCLTATALDQSSPGVLVILQGMNAEEAGVTEHLDDILNTFGDAAEDLRDNGKGLAYARA